MNLLRVLLRSVCGSHPSDVPPKSKISVQIEQNGNGRRSGAFLHISFKNSSICKAFGVRQRPPQGAEFVCVPCGANNSKSVDGNIVRVRPPPPAPHLKGSQSLEMAGFAGFFMFCAFVYCPPTSPNLRNYNEDIESSFLHIVLLDISIVAMARASIRSILVLRRLKLFRYRLVCIYFCSFKCR